MFESDRFLVSGESGRICVPLNTALFGANGMLARQIYEAEDEDAPRKAALGDAEVTHNDERGNIFAKRGDVTLGSDGNVYPLHGTSPLVCVISPTGEVL